MKRVRLIINPSLNYSRSRAGASPVIFLDSLRGLTAPAFAVMTAIGNLRAGLRVNSVKRRVFWPCPAGGEYYLSPMLIVISL